MTGRTDRIRIVVLGYLVRGPLAGLAWHHLQYVLGLARLGHDVFFFEDSDDYPSCYDPARNLTDADPSYGLGFAARCFRDLGLPDRWAYYDAHRRRWMGRAAEHALGIAASAHMVLNLSGVNPLRPWLQEVPVRVLVDTDPLFTQVRHLRNPMAKARAAQHTAFFSFGENIGRPGCEVPLDGFPWRPTRQPVVLDAWRPTPGIEHAALTSVMLWDSYPAVHHNGTSYGTKAASFTPYLDLPVRCPERFELAMGSRLAPRQQLLSFGWEIIDPREPTRDLRTYQDYIGRSKAEFGVAKQGYVISRCGWFSERSAAYLASGRPVIVQDTGFSEWLRPGGGVLPFSTPDDALARIEALNRSYERHCRAARAAAEEYFDSDKVLTDLLEAVSVRT